MSFFAVVVVVLVPTAADVVVFGDDVDAVVVDWLDLLLVVGVFRLLVLIWLMGVLMSVPGRLLVVSFAEVLAAVLLCGM